MNINFNNYPILSNNYKKVSHNYKKSNNCDCVSFGIRPQEQLVNLLASENLSKFKMTFDEAVKIYKMLGYEITRKTGSHAHIHIPGMKETIPLIDPHNGQKHLTLFDLKRMILVITNRPQEAMHVR